MNKELSPCAKICDFDRTLSLLAIPLCSSLCLSVIIPNYSSLSHPIYVSVPLLSFSATHPSVLSLCPTPASKPLIFVCLHRIVTNHRMQLCKNLCVCVCVCMCVYVCVCVRTHAFLHTFCVPCVCVHVHNIYLCICFCVFVCVCVCQFKPLPLNRLWSEGWRKSREEEEEEEEEEERNVACQEVLLPCC